MARLNRIGNTLTSQTGKVYKIYTRKKVTEHKPKHFLVRLEGKKKVYISSLYGSDPVYSLEYKGNRYTLRLSESSATIMKGADYVPSI